MHGSNTTAKDVSMVDVSNASNPTSADTMTASSSSNGSSMTEGKSNTTNDIDLDRMNLDAREDDAQVNDEDKMHVDHSSTALAQQNQTLDGSAQQQQQQHNNNAQQQQPPSQSSQQQQQPQYNQPPPPAQSKQPEAQQPQEQVFTLPVDIKWSQGGEKVYVTGSFTGWRKMIGLVKQPDGTFMITLGLPVGTHRLRFIVDNELRYSDFLPTATDQTGNIVNYIEVSPPPPKVDPAVAPTSPQAQPKEASEPGLTTRRSTRWQLTNDDDDMGNGYSRYYDQNPQDQQLVFTRDIPPIFTDPKVMEQYYVAIDKQSKSNNGQQQAWLHPPLLPPHLESVILNNFNSNENNSGALPTPNHVVLNHLATTSIKHNTLAVASIMRYKTKYITQVLYAPL
ncbi:uncharacterized protein LODBEIA_P36100 [Lodderomyces beijingensis]|uniref:Association with the SNF1 complex (ASC) domain-containing protein n=1 Tax=Lodderomyces beijingensis TaxID=1775926 RepID=A0ABP0ZMK1_9ASCO